MSIFSSALLSSISIRPSNGVRFYDGCCLDLAVFFAFPKFHNSLMSVQVVVERQCFPLLIPVRADAWMILYCS